MTGQERLDEIERDWAHVRATGGAVDLEECGTCSEAFAAVPWLLAELRTAEARNERLRVTVRRVESLAEVVARLQAADPDTGDRGASWLALLEALHPDDEPGGGDRW